MLFLLSNKSVGPFWGPIILRTTLACEYQFRQAFVSVQLVAGPQEGTTSARREELEGELARLKAQLGRTVKLEGELARLKLVDESLSSESITLTSSPARPVSD